MERTAMPRWVAPAMVAIAAVVLVGTATPPGAQLVAGVQNFLALFAGVLALVGFSVTVMMGVLATERTMLRIRHRVLVQAMHHAVALMAVAALIAHIFVKVLTGHAQPQDAVIPYFTSAKGLGPLASDLFIIVMITGLMRIRWAAAKKPGQWRALHVMSYVAWPIAILHGLTAGRAPTGLGVGPLGPWATVAYIVCMVGVGLAVLTRMFLLPRQGEPERMIPEPEIRIEMPPMAASAAAQNEDERERVNQAFWGPTK